MNTRSPRLLLCAIIASLWLPLATAATSPSTGDVPPKATADQTQEQTATPRVEVDTDHSASASDDAGHATVDIEVNDSDSNDDSSNDNGHGDHDNARVHIGSNVSLGADESATAVVAVMGSATSAGTVSESVVSVFGDTRVTGSVGEDAVAVFGSTYIDSHVKGDAVAVFGDLELGPNAIVDGDVTIVGGEIKRAPSAVLRHQPNEVSFGVFGKATGIRVWIEKCLVLLRPLAFAPGLGWAWAVAFVFLVFYALLALMFERRVEECVQTLETRPGASFGIAFLSILITPFLFVLLTVTVVGIPLIPFIAFAMFCGMLFGKAVVFAAIGKRLTRYVPSGPMSHIAAATVVGGLIAMVLYCIPVLGFIAFKVFGILGLGVVLYTIILASQARKAAQAPADGGQASVGGAAISGTTADASTPRPEGAQADLTQPAAALPRANFWIRMGALFIDTVLIAVIAHVAHINDGFLLLLATYAAIMWKLKGTTVGGTICHLRLARLDGRPIDWSTAIVRALSCFLSMAFVFLGFFWIAFDPEKQAWHDKIAGTVVVRVPRGTSLV
ncbi:MAG TPA: RDD family protein [Steroidobacteraceae bacterium]|nr:RDD family protein [Steroidobacteraceae bacterium]